MVWKFACKCSSGVSAEYAMRMVGSSSDRGSNGRCGSTGPEDVDSTAVISTISNGARPSRWSKGPWGLLPFNLRLRRATVRKPSSCYCRSRHTRMHRTDFRWSRRSESPRQLHRPRRRKRESGFHSMYRPDWATIRKLFRRSPSHLRRSALWNSDLEEVRGKCCWPTTMPSSSLCVRLRAKYSI
jgi:hypothetical protein